MEILKSEAAEKKFPDNELLRKLNTVLKDIEYCQKTSAELLSNSTTRYDGSLNKLNLYTQGWVTCTYISRSFSERKMTLAELKKLVETMQNLPCVVNQLEEVQVRRDWLVFLSDFILPKCLDYEIFYCCLFLKFVLFVGALAVYRHHLIF